MLGGRAWLVCGVLLISLQQIKRYQGFLSRLGWELRRAGRSGEAGEGRGEEGGAPRERLSLFPGGRPLWAHALRLTHLVQLLADFSLTCARPAPDPAEELSRPLLQGTPTPAGHRLPLSRMSFPSPLFTNFSFESIPPKLALGSQL